MGKMELQRLKDLERENARLKKGVTGLGVAEEHERWALDIVTDALSDGRKIRILTVVDIFSRECLALEVATSFPATRLTLVLDRVIARRKKAGAITLGKGTGFTSRHFDAGAEKAGTSGILMSTQNKLPLTLVPVMAVLVLGAVVRLFGLGRTSLWWDECHSVDTAIVIAGAPVAATVRAVWHGLSPWFLLLAPWVDQDTPEWIVRLSGALPGLLLVLLAMGLGRMIAGGALAWRLGLAVAVSPFYVWHAREARWYSLTWLLATLGLIHFVRALRRLAASDVLACMLWGFLAATTFLPVIVFLLGEAAWLGAVALRRAPAWEPSQWPGARLNLLMGLGITLAVGFWGWRTLAAPMLSGGQALGFSNLGGPRPLAVAYTVVTFATGYTLGPGPAEWHGRTPALPSVAEGVVMLVGTALLAFLCVTGVRFLRAAGQRSVILAFIALPALSITAVALAAMWSGHRYAPRHAGLACLPLLALAAAGTLPHGRRAIPGRVAGVTLLALQAVALVNLHVSPRYEREAVRPAAAMVTVSSTPRDLVLVFGGIDRPWNHYYRGPAPSRIVYPGQDDTWTPDGVRRLLVGAERVFVVRGMILGTPDEDLLLAVVENSTRLAVTTRYPAMEVSVRIVESDSARKPG